MEFLLILQVSRKITKFQESRDLSEILGTLGYLIITVKLSKNWFIKANSVLTALATYSKK